MSRRDGLGKRAANHVSKVQAKIRKVELRNPIFVSPRNICKTIVCAPYLSVGHELGEGEDIDRFPVPQGMFTPRNSVVRRTDFATRPMCRTGRHKTLCRMRVLLVEDGFSAALSCVRKTPRNHAAIAPADLEPKGLGFGVVLKRNLSRVIPCLMS